MRGAYCAHCGQPIRPGARFCPGCGSLLGTGAGVLAPGSGLQAGRYTVRRLLGRGGNGAVYLVEDTRLRRDCVAKELQGHFSTARERHEAEQDFYREALILARLSIEHPGLPQVYDFFGEGERRYLVMQYVAGLDLEQRLRTGGPLAEGEALAYGAEIADVLAFLHAQQPTPVIHRDVKPANLIVDARRRVKLVDFGLAKALPSTTSALLPGATRYTGAAGTAGYTPLEQWALQAEPRSDVYALGATLHHLLTGRDPCASFHGQGELNLELIRRLGVFPPLRTARPDLSPGLESLLAAMLAPEVRARPEAVEVQARLARMLKPGRSRVAPRSAPRPVASAPPLLGVAPLAPAALAAEVAAWLRSQVEGLPADEPILLLEARGQLVPLAISRYSVDARFEAPDGHLLHTIAARGTCVLDGTGGRPLDPPLARFVAGQQAALAPLPPPAPEVQVLPFRQAPRLLRDSMLTQVTSEQTARITYQAGNGRAYTRVCRPARRQVLLQGDDPVLLHLPHWTLRVGVRGQSYALEAYQGAAGPSALLCVLPNAVAGTVFCPTCGRLQAPALMTACAACSRRVCVRCIVNRTRLGIFRKQFCSAACAAAFATSGSVRGWL